MNETNNKSILEESIRKYETPFYLFDTDRLTKKIQTIKSILGPEPEICYAMKANPFLIKSLENNVNYFEVCSPGEFNICERSGINMNQVVLSGVYKKPEDLEYAITTYENRIIYTVESLAHWQSLSAYTKKHKISIRVLLRMTSGNQFGMDESLIRKLISENPYDYITIEGIQYFSGTQKKSAKKLEQELIMLNQFCEDLKQDYGFTVQKLEYGPGLFVNYFKDDTIEENDLLKALSLALKHLTFGGRVTLEMGRFLVACCGYYVTTVVDTKTNKNQNYCIVDGGIHHMNYYGQMLAMKKPPIIHPEEEKEEQEEKEGKKEWTVCGSLCTASDVLIRQYPFYGLKSGDHLIFEKTGAYSVTEGISLFLSRQLPQIILYSSASGFTIARPITDTDPINYFKP